jgi:hypothetical protein
MPISVACDRYANVYETTMVGMIVAIKETSPKKLTSTP